MSHTLIFDIGKTNKKCFVLDEDFQEIYQDLKYIKEIEDEDGEPCDDLTAIERWIENQLENILNKDRFDIQAVNFSTYGASLVHIDENGKLLTPLYNYLKHYPDEILYLFHEKYGDANTIAKETASPISGMLNSGLQLFWLKHTKPEVYKKIKYSLHFPQYLSYLYTGEPVSDYTSVGCHTSLWDYKKKDYHDWVYQEGINEKLAPLVTSDTSFVKHYKGKEIKFGVGIHDSSANLFPYIAAIKPPFILLSTGTWNISLNPFNDEMLTEEELDNDCLNYMQIDGKPVKAARIFLGNEHALQVEKLNRYFEKKPDYYKEIKMDNELFSNLRKFEEFKFRFESIESGQNHLGPSDLSFFNTYEAAYHRLIIELSQLQAQNTNRILGNPKNRVAYIAGGFKANSIFISVLSDLLRLFIKWASHTIGPEIGAALVIDYDESKRLLMRKYFRKWRKFLF